MPLAVQRAHEHAVVIAHVCEIHVADGLPLHVLQVNIRGQHEELSGIAISAAVVHRSRKREQLLRRCDLPGILGSTISARKHTLCCSGFDD